MTKRKPKRTRSFTQSQGPSHHQNPNIMTEADPDQSDSLQSQDPDPNEENQQQQQQQQQQEEEPPIQQLEMEMEVEEQGGEEEEEEEESQGTAISPPRLLPSAHDSNPAPPPPPLPIAPRRGGTKKRKKPTRRKRDAVEKKLRLLRQNLLPVPFVPVKTLDLTKHENLLKTLGLWDFAHLELDQFIRSDLLASLIANYDPVARCSYVKDQRINVSRPSLGRALNLPIKKDKAAAALVEFPDPDRDGLAEEAIAVVSEFMSTYMLLHEDTWMMPEEILASERLVKEGQPQKVDWARLIWFMVEKELTQAPDSGSCYYASHLQCLMKSQKPDIFKEIEVEEVSPEEDEDAAAAAERSVALDAVEERDSQKPGIELSLGQEKTEAEHVEEDSVMDFPECREEPGQWFLNERSIGIEHTLQHCTRHVLENSEGEQMDKEAEEEQYDLSMKFHKLEGVPSGGLMQGMETGNVSYGMPVNLIDPSSSEILMSRGDMNKSIPLNHNDLSMFGNAYKEEISDEDAVPHITHNDQHRKMNGAEGWNRTPEGFVVCMEQVQSWLNKARVIHEEKEEGYLRLQMNLDYLVAQLSERDGIINSLERSVLEERNKKQVEIYRLEHEHCIMTQLLHGYRKALKETNTAFAEYRERFQQPVEPIYKDVGGNGGDVLSIMELEKLRLKKEEEEGKMRSEIEEKIKAFEHDWLGKFDLHLKKVDLFDKRLLNIAKEGELLKDNSKTKRLST